MIHSTGRTSGMKSSARFICLTAILLSLLCITRAAGADTLTLPADLTVIEAEAFAGDTDITEVILPDNLEKIGSRAFAGTSLTEVVLPGSLREIAADAFDSPARVTVIAEPGTYAHDWAVENGYTEIMPDVAPLSWYTFTNYEYDRTCMLTGFTGPENFSGDIIIPQKNAEGYTVTYIGQAAFAGRSDLTGRLVIPDGITYISDNAFMSCSGLKGSLDIPSSVTGVGWNAFSGCTGFDELTLHPGLVYIGFYAFEGDSGLTGRLIIPDSVTVLGSGAFQRCTGFTGELILPEKLTYIADGVFDNCWGLTGVDIPYGVTRIGTSAFYGCSSMTWISIPESVTLIEGAAFQNCWSLKSIVLPDGITELKENLFAACSKLTAVTFPEGLTVLNSNAFSNCDSLTEIVLPDTVAGIGREVFKSCDNMTDLWIPESVTWITADVFTYCEKLARIHCAENSEIWNRIVEIGLEDKLVPWRHLPAITDPPAVTGVSIASDEIAVGTELEFTVTASNAWKVQLLVDGEGYDEYWLDENGAVSRQRIITMAGDRMVAFRAFGEGGWSEPSEAIPVYVSSEGTLDPPEFVCPDKHYMGKPLTITWAQVPFADDYRIYLTHPDGTTDRIEPRDLGAAYVPGDEYTPYSVTFSPAVFNTEGDWNFNLMAYGKGYSQSQRFTRIYVVHEYEPWEGWVQAETVPTYETAAALTANGYVDYIDPVTVKGITDNGRYLITMTLTSGETRDRYVEQADIGTVPYTPGVAVTGWYQYIDGRLIVTVRTNLEATHAGISGTNGIPFGDSYTPTRMSAYRRFFDFELPAVTENTAYTVWAADADGNTVTAQVTAAPAPESGEEPAAEASGQPAEDPEQVSRYQQYESQMQISDTVSVNPQQPEQHNQTCIHKQNGEHSDNPVILKNLTLIADKDGTIYVSGGVCATCGEKVNCGRQIAVNLGFALENGFLYDYYRTVDRGNPISGLSIENITFKRDLEITEATDLNGIDLIVEGKLTVKAPLTNVRHITCKGLQIEENMSVSADGQLKLTAGSLYMKKGSALQCSYIDSEFNADVDGTLTVKTGWKSKTITIRENAQISAAYISALGDLYIKGSNFQFEKPVYLTGYVHMDHKDVNYIRTLYLETPAITMDYYSKKTKVTYKLGGNDVSVPGTCYYRAFDKAAVEYMQTKIFPGLKSFASSSATSSYNGSQLYQLYKDVKSYVNTFKDDWGYISADKAQALFDPCGTSGQTIEQTAAGWNPQITLGSRNSDLQVDQYIQQHNDELELALKVGLLRDMFFVTSTHEVNGSGWSINFNTIKSNGWEEYRCNGEKWYIRLTSAPVDMVVNVTKDGQQQKASVTWLNGEIKKGNETVVDFIFFPANLNQAYNALMAAGFSEIRHQLESAASSAVGYLKQTAKDIDGLDKLGGTIWKEVNNRADKYLETHLISWNYCTLVNIQHQIALLDGLAGDMREFSDAFNFFRDMYEQAKKLKTNTISFD